MAGQPTHRGPAAKDKVLFGECQLPALRAAVHDLCWLLDHGYASRSATELVGNRYNLTARQRIAVGRCACSAEAARHRQGNRLSPAELRGRELWLDGYNVLTVLESALSGGIVLVGRDNCCRDLAAIHKRYRKVAETLPVLRLVGEITAGWGVSCVRWWLDQPVSNSGRLKAAIGELAAAAGWNMPVDLAFNPDKVLWESGQIIATSDGVVLDRGRHWVNLAREIITAHVPQTWLLDLSEGV